MRIGKQKNNRKMELIISLVGDYYIPDLKLPEEHRLIGNTDGCTAPGIFGENPSSPIEHIDTDRGVMDMIQT